MPPPPPSERDLPADLMDDDGSNSTLTGAGGIVFGGRKGEREFISECDCMTVCETQLRAEAKQKIISFHVGLIVPKVQDMFHLWDHWDRRS